MNKRHYSRYEQADSPRREDFDDACQDPENADRYHTEQWGGGERDVPPPRFTRQPDAFSERHQDDARYGHDDMYPRRESSVEHRRNMGSWEGAHQDRLRPSRHEPRTDDASWREPYARGSSYENSDDTWRHRDQGNAAVYGQASTPREFSTRQFRGLGPAGYKRSDERIMEDVCDQLTENPFIDARKIEVSVKDGLVTLTGRVMLRSMKFKAEDCAEHINGVKDVQNQIRVERYGDVSDDVVNDTNISR